VSISRTHEDIHHYERDSVSGYIQSHEGHTEVWGYCKNAALKEMQQLHDRGFFQLIQEESLNAKEKKRALESLIFLTESHDGAIKA